MLYTFLFKFKAVDIIRFGEESHSGLVQRIANPRPVRGSWVRIPPPPHRLVWALASGEGWQNGNARVLKTRGRKPLEVRVLYPPLSCQQTINFLVAKKLCKYSSLSCFLATFVK